MSDDPEEINKEIMEPQKSNKVELTHEITEEMLNEIVDMEHQLFLVELQTERNSILETMENPKTVTVVAFDEKGKVGGYISSVDHKQAFEDLQNVDSNMNENPNAIYIESIAIRPDLQGKGYFSKLIKKFIESAPRKTITMHARTTNSCSSAMQNNGAIYIRTIQNWFDSGEPFDYLEIHPKQD